MENLDRLWHKDITEDYLAASNFAFLPSVYTRMMHVCMYPSMWVWRGEGGELSSWVFVWVFFLFAAVWNRLVKRGKGTKCKQRQDSSLSNEQTAAIAVPNSGGVLPLTPKSKHTLSTHTVCTNPSPTDGSLELRGELRSRIAFNLKPYYDLRQTAQQHCVSTYCDGQGPAIKQASSRKTTLQPIKSFRSRPSHE